MRRIVSLLNLKYPALKVVSLQACARCAEASLVELASLAAQEISGHLQALRCQAREGLRRVSFLGHSVGALVLRLAFRNPLLTPFTRFFHLFLSLNAPHCGVTFSKRPIDWGSRFLAFVNSSQLVDELLLKDDKNPRNTLLYRMSQNSGGFFGGLEGNNAQICRRFGTSTCFRPFRIPSFRSIRSASKRIPRFCCRTEWRAKCTRKWSLRSGGSSEANPAEPK